MKSVSVMLLCAAISFLSVSCSGDEEDEVAISRSSIIGTWDVVWMEQYGESINVPAGYISMTLNADGTYRTVMLGNSYRGTYIIQGNTIIGTTLDPITEYYEFTSLIGNSAVVSYSNSVGDEYNFKATKRNISRR